MRRNIRSTSLALTLATLWGGVVSTAAQTYNATAEFSTTNGNPNGVWSYGWMPTDFSQFNLITNVSGDPLSVGWGWHLSGGGSTPSAWKNLTGSTAYGVPNGWMALHPGPGTEPGVLRWTAPNSGAVRVVGQFLPGDGGVMQVAVRQTGQTWWHAVDAGSFDLAGSVNAGDTIDFAVYGGYYGGTTPLVW